MFFYKKGVLPNQLSTLKNLMGIDYKSTSNSIRLVKHARLNVYNHFKQTGIGISSWLPVVVSAPVVLFILKITTLLVPWLATKRKLPEGSITKLRGVLPNTG